MPASAVPTGALPARAPSAATHPAALAVAHLLAGPLGVGTAMVAMIAVAVGACIWRSRPAGRGGAGCAIRASDLPHATYVRDAVVVACPPGPEGDPALRFAVQEAELRGARLVVVASYEAPVDPDLESIETPDAELRAAARASAVSALSRALGCPADALPAVQVVTETGTAGQVLLRGYSDAELIVVAEAPRGRLARLGSAHPGGAVLARDGQVPVVLVPGR